MRTIKDYIKFISEQDAPQTEAVRPNLDQWRRDTGSPNATPAPGAATGAASDASQAPLSVPPGAEPEAAPEKAATGLQEPPGSDAAPAAAPATAPAAAVAPAKSQQNYNMALQQIKALYAKAQVAYPPQDDIIRQRFGLPPALPPFDQWDGKMPEAGEADFLTRNVFGRQASKDVAAQNAANKTSAAAAGKADATVAAKVKELNDLVAKLGGGATPAAVKESIDLKRQMAKMLKESFNIDMAEEETSYDSFGTPVPKGSPQATQADAPPAAGTAAAPAAGANAELIKQIQAVMAEINANMDENNPDPEATKALQAAQAAIDKAQAAPAPAPAANPEDPSSAGAVNGMDKASDDAAAANAAKPPAAAAPANQTFGQAFKAARASGAKEFEYKGKKYSTAIKGENPALDAAMAKQKQGGAAAGAAAPAKPTAPTAPTKPTAPAAPAQSGQAPAAPAAGTFAADMAARKKANNPLNIQTKESVGYSEDQTLARIVSLANIR